MCGVKPLTHSIRSRCRAAVTTVAALLVMTGVASAQSSATLQWNANGEADLAGYRVEYGTVSGSPSTR